MGKHLVQALPFVYALQCLTGKEDKNNNISLLRWPPQSWLRVWRLAVTMGLPFFSALLGICRPLNSHDLVVRHTISAFISRLLADLTIFNKISKGTLNLLDLSPKRLVAGIT